MDDQSSQQLAARGLNKADWRSVSTDGWVPTQSHPRRDPLRIPHVVQAISEYWAAHPDLRFGQVISVLSKEAIGNYDPFYMEDTSLVGHIKKYFSEAKK